MLLRGRNGSPPVSLRGQQGQIPIPSLELPLTPLAAGISSPWKSSLRAGLAESSSLSLLQTWALPGGSFPRAQTPL